MAANIPENPSAIRLSLLMIAKVMREPSGYEWMLFHPFVHDPFLLSPHAHTLHFSLSLHDSSISHRSHPPCFVLLPNNLAQISILGSSIAHSSFLEFVRADYFAGIEPWERRENSRRVDQRISTLPPLWRFVSNVINYSALHGQSTGGR